MKKTLFLLTLALAAALTTTAAPFLSGSNGELGDVVITEGTTVDVPPNGVLNYRSLTVFQGTTLRFNVNEANTPIYILATQGIRIEGRIVVNGGSGSMNKAGRGGPGAFDGGETGQNGAIPGSGYGPGGGLSGTPGQFAGAYGNALLIPLIGGSGGGGHSLYGGGGGGGALLLASDQFITILGSIEARGGDGAGVTASGFSSPGSGGAIRLVSPRISGDGSLDVQGGFTPCGDCPSGGLGRIRVDTTNDSDARLNFSGVVRQGREMYVFPPLIPRLTITEVAGRLIAPTPSGVVNIQLARGQSPSVNIRVMLENFPNQPLSLEARVVPENGSATSFFADVPSGAAGVHIPITLAPDVSNRIQVWTR